MKEKWYKIIFLADNVASEVLDCSEARKDLSVKEMTELLVEFGESDYVTVTPEKEIIVV